MQTTTNANILSDAGQASAPAVMCALCATPHDLPGALCEPCFAVQVARRQPQTNPSKVRHRREPIFVTDIDGVAVVLLPTSKAGMTVKMLSADFRDLQDRGFTDQVTILRDAKSGFYYAMLNVTGSVGGMVTLARLIMDAKRGRNVNYVDGDRLNLRRDNLTIVRGCGRNVVQVVNKIKAAELRSAADERN